MEETISLAAKVRQFFGDLLRSSLVDRLEIDLAYARSDAERMRQEYQGIIADLRQEKSILNARISMYEAKNGLREPGSIPPKPTFGVDFSKMPPMKTKWQAVVEQHEARLAKEDEEERLAKEAKA
jgi:hypothetical protein